MCKAGLLRKQGLLFAWRGYASTVDARSESFTASACKCQGLYLLLPSGLARRVIVSVTVTVRGGVRATVISNRDSNSEGQAADKDVKQRERRRAAEIY